VPALAINNRGVWIGIIWLCQMLKSGRHPMT